MTALKNILATAAALTLAGAALAQSTPPNPAAKDPAVGAGQRSSQNTPMGATGTPAGGSASAGASTSGSTSGSTASSSGTGSTSGTSMGASGSTDTSASASGTGSTTKRSGKRARADRG
jgi:hypothetical protein